MKLPKKSLIMFIMFLTGALLLALTSSFTVIISYENPKGLSEIATTRSVNGNGRAVGCAKPKVTNLLFQSKDGGATWQDISHSLPDDQEPEGFFAGQSEVYIRIKNDLYRSAGNQPTPVWENLNVVDPRCTSIAFNNSTVVAFNAAGQFFQKMPTGEIWWPIFSGISNRFIHTVFETSQGVVFLGCEEGLLKSSDAGRSWKAVHNEGWVREVVESEGVLIATGQHGIMRSTDHGDHWEWVITERGVGIDVERIQGGFAAISFQSNTMTRRVRISTDGGLTWKPIDKGLPPSMKISSIKQVGKYLVCGHPDGIFRSGDMGATWQIVHPGIDEQVGDKVFVLHVSNGVVYAVATSAGC